MTDKDGLTKQELSWLLTQEARTAAQTLREGVSRLTLAPTQKVRPASVEIESSLDALDLLDDAMRMLDSLNTSAGKRGVRGPVDMAALVGDVVGASKLHLQPGSGTDVFGDEGELRRMVQILLGQSDVAGEEEPIPTVYLARHGENVRMSVKLGPDATGTARTERAWLARMALRYGGRLELDGSNETLWLPAAGAQEHKELEALRKELEEAQKLGEAYARELAAVFATQNVAEFSVVAPSTIPPTTDALAPLCAFSSAIAAQLKAILAGLTAQIEAPPDSSRFATYSNVSDDLRVCWQQLQDLCADLQRVAAVPIGEMPVLTDIHQLVRDVVEASAARASRNNVRITCNINPIRPLLLPARSLACVIRLLVEHAVAASYRDAHVAVTVQADASSVEVYVDDQGACVPAGARDALLWLRVDPSTIGRPRGMHLLGASVIMAHLRGELQIEDGADGGARVRATWPLK